MTEYKKPNFNDLYSIVNQFYTAFTGKEVDENVERRLKAGVEGLITLHEINPNAFYAAATIAILEGADRLNLNKNARNYLQDVVAKYLSQKSEYRNLEGKLENNNSRGGQ